MITNEQLLNSLDSLKRKQRPYLSPKDYKSFLPDRLNTPDRPDLSAISYRMGTVLDKSKAATELEFVKNKNEADYQEMVRAQKQMELAKKNLAKAHKPTIYGKPGSLNINGKVTNVWGINSVGGGSIGPGGKFRDPTPFKLHAGLGTYKWKGRSLTVNRSMANNFIGFLNALSKTGYRVTSLGSYANRNIAGTSTKSLHSYGLAIDINPSQNPVTYGYIKTNLPPGVGQLAAKYGLAWGGNWNGSKKDTMHFSKPAYGTK